MSHFQAVTFDYNYVNMLYSYMYIVKCYRCFHSEYLYSASSSPQLLRGAPDTAQSFTPKRRILPFPQATASKGLAQGSCVAARTGFEPWTLRSTAIKSTNKPPHPTMLYVIQSNATAYKYNSRISRQTSRTRGTVSFSCEGQKNCASAAPADLHGQQSTALADRGNWGLEKYRDPQCRPFLTLVLFYIALCVCPTTVSSKHH